MRSVYSWWFLNPPYSTVCNWILKQKIKNSVCTEMPLEILNPWIRGYQIYVRCSQKLNALMILFFFFYDIIIDFIISSFMKLNRNPKLTSKFVPKSFVIVMRNRARPTHVLGFSNKNSRYRVRASHVQKLVKLLKTLIWISIHLFSEFWNYIIACCFFCDIKPYTIPPWNFNPNSIHPSPEWPGG